MKADLVITNARLVDHSGEQRGAIAVSCGRIAAIGGNDAMPPAERTIDAGGRVVMPGVIDPHCHLGVNYDFDEDIRTETAGAARGGVTTILLFARSMEQRYVPYYWDRRERGERGAVVDFGFHFGIQKAEHVSEIAEIAEQTGVQTFKCHMGYEVGNSIGIHSSPDSWVFAAMREAAKLPRGVVAVHCENTELVELLKPEMKATGRGDLAAYSESRPPFVEEEAIERMIHLAEITGCPLYVVHTTVAAGPTMAAAARVRGIDVWIETCPHYLTRTAYDADLGTTAKISPPLRDRTQLDGLWEGMLNGQISTLGTDHVPFKKNGGELPVGAAADAALRRAPARDVAAAVVGAQLLQPGQAFRPASQEGLAVRGRRRGPGHDRPGRGADRRAPVRQGHLPVRGLEAQGLAGAHRVAW